MIVQRDQGKEEGVGQKKTPGGIITTDCASSRLVVTCVVRETK